MRFLVGEDWIGMAVESQRVPHSSVAAECSDPLGPASEAEMISSLLDSWSGDGEEQ